MNIWVETHGPMGQLALLHSDGPDTLYFQFGKNYYDMNVYLFTPTLDLKIKW